MLKKILGFLIGRRGEIFTSRGEVRHDFSQQQWAQWQARYSNTDDYNWRTHTGVRRGKS